MALYFFHIVFAALFLPFAHAQVIQLFLDTGALPTDVTSSSACGQALQASIACNTSLLVADNTYFDEPTTEAICTPSCYSSLVAYRQGVSTSCSTIQLQGEDITYPSTFVADELIYLYNATCLKDASTGSWCSPYFQSLNNGSVASDSSISGIPPSIACSSCTIQLGLLSQQSSYGFDPEITSDWPSIQQLCGINFNLTVPGNGYLNVSIPAQPSTVCLSGNTYNVQSGDTCTSISQTQSVGTGNLISVNGLSQTCTDIQAGQTLCLPETCSLYQVQSGDTCNSIIAQLDQVNFVQFFAWNPTINPYCTNLISGSYICISPPGGAYTYVPPTVTVAPTGTAISTSTPAPTQTAIGTIPNCGKWYVVQEGDTCNRVLLSQTITLADFISYNPEINSDCTNLLLGFAYCVYAVSPAPFPSTFAPVPTNAAVGSDNQCYSWYTVVSGDNCTSIATNQSILVSELLAWNPELNAQCTNLLLGEAYCVFAQPVGTTSTIQNATTSASPPAPTPVTTTSTATTSTSTSIPAIPTNAAPGSISPCEEWYTAVSGDYCYEICQNEGCTVANLQEWNPALGSDCVVQIGVAYCVSA